MIGICVELLISWLLLKYLQGSALSALGLTASWLRTKQFFFGLIWALGFLCALNFLVSVVVENPYRLNPEYGMPLFLKSIWTVIRSILYEELVFRGALLYMLVKRIGANRAMLLSAVCFGVYHWFSYGVFGSPLQMTVVFATTGAMGYVLAMGFCRTGSMWLPTGLHLGINLSSMVFFSATKSAGGNLLLRSYLVDPVVPSPWISIPVLILHFSGLVLLSFLMLRYRWPVSMFPRDRVG